MELTIFDVGHGFCALLRCDNGNCILFDCGYDDETGFRPSTYLPSIGVRSLQRLVIGNFDADHVADLANLLQSVSVETFFRNRTISAAQLTGIKLSAGFLSAGMRAALKLHQTYIEPIVNPPDLAGVQIRHFCNPYPTFTTTNDLSLVSFVLYDGIGVVFPGDLEKAGWEALLELPDFRVWLNAVTIFIASHHGRESGYCAEVFDYCSPEIVILSDKEIQHETQEHCYDEHATGIQWTDLGLPHPEQELLKAKLTLQIYRLIKGRNLTQAEAGKILGTKQPHVSLLMRNRSGSFSVERLMDFLTALGQDVEISVKPARRDKDRGEVSVVA